MSHDKNGNLVQIGDLVTITCKVDSIQMQEDYCNVGLKTISPMPPYTEPSSITLNMKQVELVKK